MQGFLTARKIEILQEAHYSSFGRKQADRIKSILLLNKGLSFIQVAEILMLDGTTIRRYQKEFKKTGIDGLLECRSHGSVGFLTDKQEKQLTRHLKKNIYKTGKEVVSYVMLTYGKTYSLDGMTHLLHRLGFVYRKTKVIPGKVDLIKQEQFKKEYYALKQTKQSKDKIYFLDAAHPHHNNEPFYGWIYKGEEKAIKNQYRTGTSQPQWSIKP